MPATRRQFLASALAAALAAPLAPRARACINLAARETALLRIRDIEMRHGARLGVSILEVARGQRFSHRGDERFPMCSTFKALLAGQVLAAVDAGAERLDRRLTWTSGDLQSWSPTVENGDPAVGLTVAELCAGAVSHSDNTAANLLLLAHGGPAGMTTWLRSVGDATTRLDRMEPQLNHSEPGDPRDTTTPAAMATTLRTLLLGDVLSPASRALLTRWMLETSTGDARLRAGLPGWRVADKTGTSGTTHSNDVAAAWPPGGGAPVLVSAYYAESRATPAQRDAVIAEVGRIVAAWATA